MNFLRKSNTAEKVITEAALTTTFDEHCNKRCLLKNWSCYMRKYGRQFSSKLEPNAEKYKQ